MKIIPERKAKNLIKEGLADRSSWIQKDGKYYAVIRHSISLQFIGIYELRDNSREKKLAISALTC